MSNEPAAQVISRRPLSLRELFCLTTLAGLLLALMLSAKWTNHERWLLGLTLGGSLLGIAVARACKQRGWLIGIIAGSCGGLVTVAIIGQEWLATLNERTARGGWSAAELAGLRNQYLAAAAVTLGLALLLALLAVACYLLLVWATDSGEQGLIRTVRRHPYRASAVTLVVVALVLCVINVDFLLSPRAWRPRVFIPQSRIENPVFISHGVMTVRRGSLSHNGDWLFVERFVTGVNHPVTEKTLFRLDPQPQAVPFAKDPDKAEHVTFDCTANRLVFLEWPNYQLRIVDLELQTSEIVSEPPPTVNPHSVQWLPNGALVFHYGDTYYGREGHAQLQRGADGKWMRHESAVVTTFDLHSGQALEFSPEGMRIVDVKSSREVEAFSQKWVEKLVEPFDGDMSSYFDLSPDARFLTVSNKIYDRQMQTTRQWRIEKGYSQPNFRGFMPRGHALLHGDFNFVAWRPYYFLTDVPFGHWLWTRLVCEPIRLIDPATGREVARTQALSDYPSTISLSYDGSRMAVFTDEGVYVYDVPAKFR